MPCLLALGGLFLPRLILFLLWVFTNYLGRAFDSFLWPLLGFFFLPTTTLAWAWSINTRGSVGGVHLVIVILALLVDLGMIGGGRSSLARRRS